MKTTEDFDAMICSFDPENCVSFFAGMKDSERKSFSERAELWHDLCVAHRETSMWNGSMGWMNGNEFLPKRTQNQIALLKKVDAKEIKISTKFRQPQCIVLAELSMLGCSALPQLRKIGVRTPEHAFAIMKERKPKWFDKWLNHACDSAPHVCWNYTRKIEREEGIKIEHGDGFWLGMALELGQMQPDDLASYILSDAEMKDEMLWKMLENDRAIRGLTDPTATTQQLVRGGGREQWGLLSHLAENNRRATYLWKLALVELSKRDEQIKLRLMEICFHWLARLAADSESKSSSGLMGEFAPTNWFQTLHDELNCNETERASHASSYLSLLSLKDTSTLTWAIDKVAGLPLDDVANEDVLNSLTRVFYHKRKDPAIAALKFLDRLYQNDKSKATELALAAVEGLEHSSTEVQKKVLSFLKKTKQVNNPELQSALEARQHLLSGLVRQELNEILQSKEGEEATKDLSNKNNDVLPIPIGAEGNIVPFKKKGTAAMHESSQDSISHVGGSIASAGAVHMQVDTTSAKPAQEEMNASISTTDFANQIERLKAQASALEERFLDIAGVSSAFNAIEAAEAIGVIDWSESNDYPRLNPDKRMTPVENLDDLIFLYLHILEGTANCDDIERLLDGIARLNNIRPLDFENRVSSLRKKVANTEMNLTQFPRPLQAFGGFSYQFDLQALALGWMDVKAPGNPSGLFTKVLKTIGITDDLNLIPDYLKPSSDFNLGKAMPLSFFSERLKEILKIINKRVSLPLLSAPTHAGGWIDPQVIPERIQAWKNADVPLLMTDVIQMMLRLAPDGRSGVKLPAAADEITRAIAYAFGAEITGSLKTPELWIAAFRCRDPFGSSELLNNSFPGLGPDSAIAAKYHDSMEEFKKREDRIFTWNQQAEDLLPLQVSPKVVPRANLRFFPIELIHDRTGFFDGNDILEYYFLQNREPYFAYLGRRTALFMDSQGEYWKSSWNCVFDPDLPLHKMGAWILVFALSAKQADQARLALDACIAAIEENRIDPVAFGTDMEKVLSTGKITLSRWVSALKETMRVSPLHLDFVHRALEICIAELPLQTASKPPIPLLELFYDSCVSSGYIIKNLKTRNYLERVEGKGKAAKLAKLLCDLHEEKSQKHLEGVSLQTLRARLDRAERWQRWKKNRSTERDSLSIPTV